MSSKMKNSNWYHNIIATDQENVISVITRRFDEDSAGLIHKFLGVELSRIKQRKTTHKAHIKRDKLYDVLNLFSDYQQYKEIEFLKECISYFNNSKKETEYLTLTFCNS